jgi:teichuronic acid biosynthesis glycosyltransferase TuaG
MVFQRRIYTIIWVKGEKKMLCDEEKVSVIMPCYNSSRFIIDAIESVQNQTYEKWELIIVDDGSTDDTVSKIKNIIKKDNRIKLFVNKQNSGAAMSRNKAISLATGRYIAFLDSDDLWHPNKLEKQLRFMQEGDLAFTFTMYSLIDEEGKELNKVVRIPNKINYKDLLKNTIIGCLTVMIDSKKIKNLKMPTIKPEDTATWLCILRNGYSAYGLQEVLAKYRIVRGSASRNKIKAALNYWKLLRYQENINTFYASWCFFNYAINALRKYV